MTTGKVLNTWSIVRLRKGKKGFFYVLTMRPTCDEREEEEEEKASLPSRDVNSRYYGRGEDTRKSI